VSQKETTQRLNDFSSLKSLDAVQVAQEDEQEVLGKLGLSPKNHELLQQALQESQRQGASGVSTPSSTVQSDSDRLHLIALTFWDTHSEDGDIVHVSSEGYERDITLKKMPITVNLPCKNMSRVKIAGVRDGGGGITLGVKGQQTVNMPIMRPGQSFELAIGLPQ